MAPENPKPGDAGEHQDQSIKDRKFQLFDEPRVDGDDAAILKPFSHYVRQTPAAPLSPGVKASLWATAVLVALLFLVAMFGGRDKKHRRSQALLSPAYPGLSRISAEIPVRGRTA